MLVYVSGSTVSHFTAPSRRGRLYCSFTVSLLCVEKNPGGRFNHVLNSCCIGTYVPQEAHLFFFFVRNAFSLDVPFVSIFVIHTYVS